MISFGDIQPKLEKEGIKFHTIYAPESTHKNQAFELAREGKYELIQKEMLSPMAIAFQDHVKAHRGAKLDQNVPGLLSGKMFFAKDALKAGLIDGIGSMPDAIDKVRALSANYKLKKALSNV
jgi:protease-4